MQFAKAVANSALEVFERRLFEPCQRLNILGAHPLLRRADVVLRHTFPGLGSFRRQIPRRLLGDPSRFSEGQWVQVLDRESIQRTLNADSKLRGLTFIPAQWDFCGGTHQVEKVMRRIVDDQGTFRPVSGTVLLKGVDCGGPSGNGGCGRRCPLMFRDEWLKEAPSPAAHKGRTTSDKIYRRVRSAEEIRGTLDRHGKKDGLMFMPEMFQWAGMRFPVAHQVTSVFEFDGTKHQGYVPARFAVYILEGLACSGAVLGSNGPCHRRCSILWHKDWLIDDN
jgi:hypothetical protein